LAVIPFHRVGRINQATDLSREGKVGGQIFPVVFPGADGYGILAAPLITELDQVDFGYFAGGRLVDFSQIQLRQQLART
jgi:hypothetical protein